MRPHSPLDPQMLFEKHGAFVRRLAGAMVADEHMAEDLAHDTWAAVVSRPPVGVRDVRAWLSTILQRRVASYRRRVGKGDRVQPVDSESAFADAEDATQQLEYEHVLHAAVRALAEPYRSTVYLRFHEGLPPREIAARSGVPVKTVKTRLSRALAKLRGTLDAEFNDQPDSRTNWRHALAPIGAQGLAATKLVSASPAVHLGSSTSPLLFGMKKLVVVAVLVLASVAWLYQRSSPFDQGLTGRAEGSGSVAMVGEEPPVPGAKLAAPFEGEDPDRVARAPRPAASVGAVAADPGAIIVHVRDARGEAIADRPIVLKVWAWASAGEPALVRRTDGSGRVAFHGLRSSHYVVLDGHGGTEEDFEIEQGETKNLQWTVEGDVLVRGQVLDVRDRPVAGADIWGAASGGSEDPIWHAVRTDIQGRFEVRCSASALLQATAPGLIPSPLRAVGRLPEREPGAREVTLRLEHPGRSLGGRVVDENGDPIQGASVVVLPGGWPDRSDSPGSTPRPTPAYSDAAGWFEYPGGLPEGEHQAVARASGFAAAVTTVVIGQPPVAREFVLHRGVEVSGIVTHPDGRPAPKANVWIAAPESKWQVYGNSFGPSVKGDSEGRFTLRGVPPGEVSVRAQSGWKEALARAVQTMEVRDQSLGGIQLMLDTGRTISGRILDPDGLPISGIVVTARCLWGESNDVTTHADGTYLISALPEPDGGKDEWDVVVRTWTGAGVRLLGSRSRVAPYSENVDFVVERVEETSGSMTGRIVADSEKIPGDVQAFLGEQGSRGSIPIAFDADSGAFSKTTLRPGTYRVRLLRAGVPVVAKSGLVVGPGETIDAGVIRLDDGGSLEVRPALSADLSIDASELDAMFQEAAASVVGPGGNQVWLKWSDGAWRHRGTLEPGLWRVMIFAEQLILPGREVTVEPGALGRFDIDVAPGRRVDVRVEMPVDSAAWSEVKIVIRDGEDRVIYDGPAMPRAALESPTATNVVWTVPMGTIRISVTTDTGVGAEQSVAVPFGDEPVWTLPMTAR